MSTFVHRLAASCRARESLLCVGLDPDPALMAIPDIVEFNKGIVDNALENTKRIDDIQRVESDLGQRLDRGLQNLTGDLEKLKGTKFYVPPSSPLKPVKSYDLLLVRKGSGGGFGDPLDRDPQRVVADFHRQAISLETAREVYGVVFDPETLALDEEATRQLRKTLRGERLRVAKPASEVLGVRS